MINTAARLQAAAPVNETSASPVLTAIRTSKPGILEDDGPDVTAAKLTLQQSAPRRERLGPVADRLPPRRPRCGQGEVGVDEVVDEVEERVVRPVAGRHRVARARVGVEREPVPAWTAVEARSPFGRDPRRRGDVAGNARRDSGSGGSGAGRRAGLGPSLLVGARRDGEVARRSSRRSSSPSSAYPEWELLERRPGWGGGKLNALVLALSPLADQETATLLAAVLERAVLPAETQTALLERAGGNPLYAEQFARLYRETGGTDELPESIQGIVAARLDELSQDEKALLQDAAVLGKVFWIGALAVMGGEKVATLLHGLERKEFVRRERRAAVGGEAEYAFRHILVRDVAYGQIPRAKRSEKHEAAARWIEALGRPEDHAELVAHHYAAALDLARAAGRETSELVLRVRTALREAGDRSLALSAFGAAEQHYRSALELWPAGDSERALVLFGLVRARAWEGRAGEEELREAAGALVEAERPDLAAEAEFLVGDLAWYAGRGEVADEQLRRALALVEPLPDSRSKAWILSQAARMAMLAARHDESLAYGRRALELADALGLPEVRAHTLASVGGVRAYRGEPEGIAELEEGVALAQELNSPGLARSLNNLAAVYDACGRTREAVETNRAAVAAAERFGLRAMGMFSRGNFLYYLYRQGRWDEASTAADALIEEAVTLGLHSGERLALLSRTLIRLDRADISGAEEDSVRVLDLARVAGDPQAVIPALANRVVVLVDTGRLEEALPLAEELRSATADAALPFSAGTEAVSIARCIGVDACLAALEGRSTWRTPWLDAIAELLRGDPDRAVELYAALDSPKDEAFARLRATEAHLAAGRTTAAKAHLEAALVFYRAAGAKRYVAEAEALLLRLASGAA